VKALNAGTEVHKQLKGKEKTKGQKNQKRGVFTSDIWQFDKVMKKKNGLIFMFLKFVCTSKLKNETFV